MKNIKNVNLTLKGYNLITNFFKIKWQQIIFKNKLLCKNVISVLNVQIVIGHPVYY